MGIELISSISQFAPSVRNPDPTRVATAAKRAEAAGFDNVLVGYGSTSADGWMTASQALFHTTQLKALLAHRPGFMIPTVAARLAATLDVYSGGRLTLNIITGGSAGDQRRDGDFEDHDTRYRRSVEYVELMKRVWTATEPFDFQGDFYHVERAFHQIKSVQKPHPRVYLGGASDAAKVLAGKQADVYMSWSEPVGEVRRRFDEIRELVLAEGRPAPGFSVSMRLILGDTEDDAWKRARAMIPAELATKPIRAAHSEDIGRNRQLALAATSDVHDERLWMGITAITGGQGSTGALVGTVDQVIASLLKYVEAGATHLLLTGPDGAYADFPPNLIPDLRMEADKILASRRLFAAG